MHVLFEDDGQLKAGTILTDNDASLQVEAASGKRLKIKAAAVLLRYAEPSPPMLIAEAQKEARGLDPNFLWDVSGDDDFGFGARDGTCPDDSLVRLASLDHAVWHGGVGFFRCGAS